MPRSEVPVEALGLSTRPITMLLRHGIRTFGELCRLTEHDLHQIRQLGASSVAEILKLRRLLLEADQAQPGNLEGWLDVCLYRLKPWHRQLLMLRFGLESGVPCTVAEVARVIGISTNHVYKIEDTLTKRFRGLVVTHRLEPLRQFLTETMAEHGGSIAESDLAIALANRFPAGKIHPLAFLHFILPLCRIDPPPPPLNRKSQEPKMPETLEGWFNLCFGDPRTHQRRILMLRYGLDDGLPRTQVETGRIVGLKKHTICGHIKAASRPLKSPQVMRFLEDLGRWCAEMLSAHGGRMTTVDLADAMARRYPPGQIHPTAFARFILPLCPGIVPADGDRWAVPSFQDPCLPIVDVMERHLAEVGHPLTVPDLITQVMQKVEGVGESVVRIALAMSPGLCVADGWCVLRSWGRTEPIRWTLAALHQIGRPAHYREVASVLRQICPSERTATDTTVEGRLLHAAEARRVWRGTYVLRRDVAESVRAMATLKDWTDRCFLGITPHQARVIRLHYGLEDGIARTFRQVGQSLGIAPQSAQSSAYQAMRRLAEADLLRELTGTTAADDLAAELTARYPTGGIDPAAFARFVQSLNRIRMMAAQNSQVGPPGNGAPA